ncbi:hypothetical protein C8C83_0683 [Flavobacterium sp. 90]|uniref:hypothetical protein n=1 Tax=unclassified Flavobacterium TaxID=196869 RepID=UPI000EB04C4C|nr:MULTISPECIES: hypothetical protein [unclassified Flavobacterium]RKR09083.1 hypothetical protein C8C82_0981 [Flavobacterium sp. 81]TCK52867.1 hypothetical protein C8C83_0683 [Flavobacterium sp. 90]
MFENYSYKQKFYALIGLFFILSIAAYKRSFHTLFDVVMEYRTLLKKADDIDKKTKNASTLVKDIAYLDKIIGKEGVAKEMVQQGIISFAAENSPEVSISDLKPIHDYPEDNYHVITNQLDVTGDSNQVLKLAYNFEKQFNLSRIVSMNFYIVKNNNKSDVLHLKMIFQNYENNK